MKPKHTPEYCAYVNALREFEAAHKAWMDLPVWSPSGIAAKGYKNSSLCRLTEARKQWEKLKRSDEITHQSTGGQLK